jgi:hypothetical protein
MLPPFSGFAQLTHLRSVVLLFSFFLSLLGPGMAAYAAPSESGAPDRVEVGIWFNGLHTMDFLDGSFGAEFYLWWISPNPDFDPFQVFQVLNGRKWSVRAVNRRVLPDGSYYTSGMVSVTVNHDWDLLYYPFDRQRLQIIIETPFTASELRLVPNPRDSVVSQFVDVEGFEVTGLSLEEHLEQYDTDFGLRDNNGRQFSRLVIEVDLKRESGRIVVAILIGFIVANLIALFTYMIHVSMLSVRATMVASAIFSAVGNTYLVNSVVHPAVGSLLLDRIALGSFAAILVALLNGIIVDRLFMHQKAGLARKVNWTVLALAVLGSAVFYSLAFQAAIRSSA